MKKVSNEEFEKAYGDQNNKNVIKSVTRKYSNRLCPEMQRTCGMHGLWKCIQSHDDKYGRKFTTSLFIHVGWECKREISFMDKKPIVFLGDYDSDLSQELFETDFPEMLEVLSEKQKKIMYQRYYENKTLKEIGVENGYTKEAARQNINKTIRKLRDYYSSMGLVYL